MFTDLEENAELPEENYYAFLNLPRDATSEQINGAYRKLSRIYHPDKHVEVEKKEKAEQMFNRTKKAYEVLSDPHKRAVYDTIGIKGLQADGWELIPRTKTPSEIREEYENLSRKAEERKLQQMTNPRGNITINVNATEVFSPYDDPDLPKIEVSSMSISQSIDTPLTRKDTIIMSGNLYSSNGNGSGGFVICGRRLINRGWIELNAGAGDGPVVGIKGGTSLTSTCTLNGGTSLAIKSNGILPLFFSSISVQLDKCTVGSLTLNAGSQSSLSTQVDRSNENSAWNTSVVIGRPHIYFNISYTHKMVENKMKLKVAAKVGTFGFLAEYGAEKRVSQYSTVFASVTLGVPTGVVLKFKIVRSNQSYIFPIHLSEEILPAAVFYATVTPVCIWFFVKNAVIDPIVTESRNEEIEKFKRKNEREMALKKSEAIAAAELMQQTYERIVAEERRRDGLIISKATYCVASDAQNGPNGDCLDVTIPLQCLVKDGQLILYNTSKSELPGFYDVCLKEDKILNIKYIFKNVENEIIINDKDPVIIPSKSSN